MSEVFEQLAPKHIEFIQRQHLFFVGTGGPDGTINVSPKGMDSLRVLSPNEIVWLNLTGSGNETAAHLRDANRMTIMFCSFDRQPLILRLYGTATITHPRDEEQWTRYQEMFAAHPGTRQFFTQKIDKVQTSCGFAVPLFDLKAERDTLTKWAGNLGEDEIKAYWEKKNQNSIDGKPTHIFSD